MMIAIAATAQVKAAPPAASYFPLAPHSMWVYSLSNQPGTEFAIKTLDPIPDPGATDGTQETPCSLTMNGQETAKLAYEFKDNALFIVAGADGLPIPPRRVMIFSANQTWIYLMDTNSVIYTDPIEVTNKTTVGKPEKWLGQVHNILICVANMKIGKGKDFDMTQTSTYAEGLGLVKLEQKGRTGKAKIDSVQTLIKYTPGAPVSL